jgi:hypothetical protein
MAAGVTDDVSKVEEGDNVVIHCCVPQGRPEPLFVSPLAITLPNRANTPKVAAHSVVAGDQQSDQRN